MKLNSLQKVEQALAQGSNEIKVSADIISQAVAPLQRMLSFAQQI